MRHVETILLIAACLALESSALSAETHTAEGRQAMVTTVHPLATEAGVTAMREGGNAVDAAVAAALTLGVVDGHNSGIGGGCFMLLRLADGRLVALDGRETAPARADRNMYLRDGRVQTQLSKTGALAVGTPGALAAYGRAVQDYGRRNFSDLLLPAAQIAEDGFAIDRVFAARLQSESKALRKFSGSHAIFFDDEDRPLRADQRLRQPDLAATYRAIAKHGLDWFYRGPFATKVDRWMRENGGLLSADDLANYRTRLREPVQSTYRDYQIVGFPPPSSGGVHVAQILNIVENFRLGTAQPDELVHIVAESMKLAFADRAYWLGDPEFAKVPRGLIDKQYARQFAQKVHLNRVTEVANHGTPPDWQHDLFGRHTTHIATADAEGNWVAITTTVNTPFGSKVIVPGTGVILNNQMDDFSVQPGVPNAFGLVGAEANAIAPGKRPLSSMSPTIVLRDGQPVMTLGAAGGPRIISQVAWTLVQKMDRGKTLAQAVAAPRFHHQWSPDRLFVEMTFPKQLADAMRARGHKISAMPYSGVTQAIGVADNGQTLIGVHDPRIPGSAAGW